MTEKQRKRASADRRAEILEAAFDTFCERGFGGASMREIATRAKASKETVYSWFGNKEQLFETLLLEQFGKFIAGAVPEAVAEEPRAFLTHVARGLLALAGSSRLNTLFRVTLAEGTQFEVGRRILRETAMTGRKDFVAKFEKWRARGLMRFDDAEHTASMFIAMAYGEWRDFLALGIVDGIGPEEIEGHADFAVDMFLKAVAPAPPVLAAHRDSA